MHGGWGTSIFQVGITGTIGYLDEVQYIGKFINQNTIKFGISVVLYFR